MLGLVIIKCTPVAVNCTSGRPESYIKINSVAGSKNLRNVDFSGVFNQFTAIKIKEKESCETAE